MKAKNIPKMPKDMPLQYKRWWRRIMKVIDKSVLMPCDVFCLEMACTNLGVYERMAKDIKRRGTKVIYLDDKKMLSDWEKILTMSFDQLLLSREARNDLMEHMSTKFATRCTLINNYSIHFL